MATKSLLTIEPYQPRCVDALLALNEAAFSSDWGERWSDQDLRGALSLTGVTALLARQGAHALSGFMLARTVVDEAEILLVGVLPEERGSGIASALLDYFLAQAADIGLTKVFLEVREGNDPARALYKRMGFVQIGRRDQYYRAKSGKMSAAITLANTCF